LAVVIEQPELLADPRFGDRDGRIAHQPELIRLLTGIFKARPRAEWCRRLEQHDVPHAPMYDASDALEDPQARHLQLLISAQHPTMGEFKTVRSPISYDGERSLEVRPPPVLGEHTDEVLAELGR
jgi:crotonobetainyl-CoA:carnitine CoA-transferase CaiB-like acyl-CoA transferase